MKAVLKRIVKSVFHSCLRHWRPRGSQWRQGEVETTGKTWAKKSWRALRLLSNFFFSQWGQGKVETTGKYRERKVGRLLSFSPTFSLPMFCQLFRLSFAPTDCPWVSEYELPSMMITLHTKLLGSAHLVSYLSL